MYQKIKLILDEIIKNSSKKTLIKKVKENQELVKLLLEVYPGIPIKNAVYSFKRGYISTPKCLNKNCQNITSFVNYYPTTFCSISCSSTHDIEQKQKKRGETNLKRHGTKNVLSNKEIRAKCVRTIKKRNNGRGVTNKSLESIKSRTDNLNKKGRDTIKKKYGVDNAIQIPNSIEKRKQTNLRKYGKNNFTKSKTKEEIITELSNIEYEILDIIYPSAEDLKIYPYRNYKIKFKCFGCEEEEILPSETFKFRRREYSNPCKACSGIKDNISSNEKEIDNFFKELNQEVINNNRDIIPPKEIDIFLPNHNLAIEHNGIFWHTESKGRDKNYHLDKTNSCKQKGINLIHIFEDEWNDKQNIVKSILRSKIGMSNKLFARKCEVKLITTKDVNEFCDKNHIQSSVHSNINIGLYYYNNIKSIMAFSKVNPSSGKSDCEWELVRFCSELDLTIIGGASKLFSFFIRNYNPENIISYSDKRWGEENLYINLGFEYSGDTNPNYWYVKNSVRYHRNNFTKHNLVKSGYDKNKSEKEIMEDLGYDTIWDCGNSIWSWKKGSF